MLAIPTQTLHNILFPALLWSTSSLPIADITNNNWNNPIMLLSLKRLILSPYRLAKHPDNASSEAECVNGEAEGGSDRVCRSLA